MSRSRRGNVIWKQVSREYGNRRYHYEENLLTFGRFRTVEKGSYPTQITGLFHGEVEWSERVPLKRKFNHWKRRLHKPMLHLKNFPSMALNTMLTFKVSIPAHAEIKRNHGIDGYLMSTSPRIINQPRALLYREQIRQVYMREREEAFRRREEMIHDFVQKRVKELNPAAVNPFWTVEGRRTFIPVNPPPPKVRRRPKGPDEGDSGETGVREDGAEGPSEALAKQ